MKTYAMMPYWLEYEGDKEISERKGLQKLGGRCLLNYTLELLDRSPSIQETFVYASSPKILEFIEAGINVTYLPRAPSLDGEIVPIEDIIAAFLAETDAEVVVLLHPTSPFLQAESLEDCIHAVTSGAYESACTAFLFQKFAWFKGTPLNYDIGAPTPNLRRVAPVIIEQSSLYVFTRTMFLSRSKRIDSDGYFRFISHFEGHEVSEEKDLELARLIVNSGMFELSGK